MLPSSIHPNNAHSFTAFKRGLSELSDIRFDRFHGTTGLTNQQFTARTWEWAQKSAEKILGMMQFTIERGHFEKDFQKISLKIKTEIALEKIQSAKNDLGTPDERNLYILFRFLHECPPHTRDLIILGWIAQEWYLFHKDDEWFVSDQPIFRQVILSIAYNECPDGTLVASVLRCAVNCEVINVKRGKLFPDNHIEIEEDDED